MLPSSANFLKVPELRISKRLGHQHKLQLQFKIRITMTPLKSAWQGCLRPQLILRNDYLLFMSIGCLQLMHSVIQLLNLLLKLLTATASSLQLCHLKSHKNIISLQTKRPKEYIDILIYSWKIVNVATL